MGGGRREEGREEGGRRGGRTKVGVRGLEGRKVGEGGGKMGREERGRDGGTEGGRRKVGVRELEGSWNGGRWGMEEERGRKGG